MKLAFYYHVPVSTHSGAIKMPGYLGVFIDALAREVEELYLVAHEAKEVESLHCDYNVSSNNVRMVNLGFKTPAWHRELFHRKILKSALRQIEHCDVLLVRSPTPLAVYFHKYIKKPKICYMVVGDYKASMTEFEVKNLRALAVKYYTLYNDHKFKNTIKGKFLIVNSEKLFNQFREHSEKLFLVKTTTLCKNDFCFRTDSFGEIQDKVKILYTGRITKEKGLDNILKACLELLQSGINIELHIAGMLVPTQEDYIDKLTKTALQAGKNIIHYHGYKKVGVELNQLYRNSHIYIIASTSDFEGFPRTVWEAMANCCPVIATRVGSIPYYLKHEHHALLIEPKNVSAIVESVKRLVSDKVLRQTLIRNGYELAQGNTLEIQTKRLVETLEQHLF